MKKSEKLFEILRAQRLIAFMAPKSAGDCMIAYETLSPLGITLEIAFRTEAALEGIQATVQKYPDALLMAGTVMTSAQAESAIEAGAAGIISADYIASVVETCVAADIMCVPGGLGDAGKQLAQKAGLYGCEFTSLAREYPYQWVHKLFPATTPQLNFLSLANAWKGAFRGLQMIYTGGISLNNLKDLAAMDPDGIFCGSAVTQSIQEPEKMKAEAIEWLNILGSVHP